MGSPAAGRVFLDSPAVVGHRGAPWAHRENTLASFAAAARAGAGWVELDARRAADGAVAVHHDAWTADRTELATMSTPALQAAGIELLGRLLDALPAGLGVDIELKNTPGDPDFDHEQALARLVAEVVAPRVGSRPLLVSSFNPGALAVVADRAEAVPTGLVVTSGFRMDAATELAADLDVAVLCPHVDCRALDPDTIHAAHAAGLEVMVWTVDDMDEARRLAAAGVDALCTNDPAGLVAALTGS